MSTDKEALQRVQGALYHLRRGLAPFVEARMKARHGPQWQVYASRAVGGDPRGALDEYALLKTIIDSWGDAFGEAFDRRDRHRVRNFVSTALEARNATSHLSLPLQDHEALRYLDAIHEVLRAVKAPGPEIAETKRLYDEQRQSGIAAPADAAPTTAPPLVAERPLSDKTRKALRPWIEVALPHPDVLENRFKQAEFAADLFAVDSGNAEGDYATPRSFFGITFLTEGLKRVLVSALQRLCGQGGDPVIGLQTAFGGGKTHTLLALYHLARHMAEGGDPTDVPGLRPLVEGFGKVTWPEPQLAAFVGSSKGTDVSLTLKDGPRLRTLWGYLAWRLAREAGLKLVAEAEAARTNPGSELMVEVFRLAGPSVILLDELVMFARQLDDARFEAFLSFIQSLTEAAKMAPGVLIVGSLIESGPEAGGSRGLEALVRLEKVFGRVQSAWLPASGNETYEIVRRRLFQALDADGERAREDTVRAFADFYRRNAAELPPRVRQPSYQKKLRLSYPIHPELFDRLSRDWSTLEKFQRTRDVLRFMANVVGVLWQERVPDPLILPARVPVAHERVRTSVLYPLDPHFASVVDSEVDGDGSLPWQLETNPSRRISQARAASRAARAVFLCSAPLVGQPNAGLTGQGLRLACAEPGDQLAIFGEALRELSEGATYLHEHAGRYWFSTQPTLNQLADGLARALPAHEVDEAIIAVLREDAKTRSGFHRVFGAPDDPTTIDEVDAISLVILGPKTAHLGRGPGKSDATAAVTDTLMRCRRAQRRVKNNLLFVAADAAQLATAREAMRRALAWESIGGDPRQNNRVDKRLQDQMTQAQLADAREKARNSRDGAVRAVRTAWSHVLFPIESTEPGKPFDLDHLSITARERSGVPAAVYEKASAKGDGIIKETLGGETLATRLAELWPADRPHLPVSEIADWFAIYVYLPKLRDRVVLETAICNALAKLDPKIAYADSFDETTGKYVGLLWQKAPIGPIPKTALLVRPEVAMAQLRAASPEPGPKPLDDVVGPAVPKPPATISNQPLHRFFGSVEIDMVRPVRAFEGILSAVVAELQRASGAKVKLTLEIQADAEEGFSEADVGVVRDNARQLKFKPESTGFE